jgi:hypothetical protein
MWSQFRAASKTNFPLIGAFPMAFVDDEEVVASSGEIPQDFIVQNIAATPEPGSLFLFGTGFFGGARMAFRRAQSLVGR